MTPDQTTELGAGSNPLSMDAEGWLRGVRLCPSPNFNERPACGGISLLVIHNISLPPGQFGGGYIEKFFCNQLPSHEDPYFPTIDALKVSAHCLIDRSGAIVQFVAFSRRAWHAGASSFAGESNCNDFSIGIELEGTDQLEYTSAQYNSLAVLSNLLLASYPHITPDRIVGHSDIAPDRKTDPGAAFDWSLFRHLIGVDSCT